MPTDRSDSPPSAPPASQYRRASLTPGASFTELFSKRRGSGPNMNNQAGSPAFPRPITTAATNAQSNQRRLSTTTLGLSGSPTQTSPFGNLAIRRESLSSSVGSNSAVFEEAVDDSENTAPGNQGSPFARRLSFGAQALREVRGGSGTGNVGEGFNWSEALRTRAERAPSVGGVAPASPQGQQSSVTPQTHHQRAASIAIMEQPTREMPKEPRQNKPDFFQEKILRADFMD